MTMSQTLPLSLSLSLSLSPSEEAQKARVGHCLNDDFDCATATRPKKLDQRPTFSVDASLAFDGVPSSVRSSPFLSFSFFALSTRFLFFVFCFVLFLFFFCFFFAFFCLFSLSPLVGFYDLRLGAVGGRRNGGRGTAHGVGREQTGRQQPRRDHSPLSVPCLQVALTSLKKHFTPHARTHARTHSLGGCEVRVRHSMSHLISPKDVLLSFHSALALSRPSRRQITRTCCTVRAPYSTHPCHVIGHMYLSSSGARVAWRVHGVSVQCSVFSVRCSVFSVQRQCQCQLSQCDCSSQLASCDLVQTLIYFFFSVRVCVGLFFSVLGFRTGRRPRKGRYGYTAKSRAHFRGWFWEG